MFKWPGVPSPRAPIHELADFAELTCWQYNRASATELSRLLGRLEDNEYPDGVEEEDEADGDVEMAYEEIERRQEACGHGYPFAIGVNGQTLQANQDANAKQVIYKYLLLATRLDMRKSTFAGIDGTRLFERLSAEVARGYFGKRAESLVFGARAGSSNFETRINDLCRRLEEGGKYSNTAPRGMRPQDDKLDVVVWKSFIDRFPGKLIGFGQCKTGTNWRNSISQLRPDAFIKNWIQPALPVTPVRMFFVSEALKMLKDERYYLATNGGLIFDRCRVIDFSGGVSYDLMNDVTKWTAAAAAANELPS